jgi:myo-inositol-1(or 4)-monophosphatase
MTAVPPDPAFNPRVHDLDALLALATDVAREAGAKLLLLRDVARTDVGTKSSATDMVSDADRSSERLIVERILAARPDDAILGEEGGERPGTSGVRWVVDPLDGTTNYLYGQPGFCVSVGIEADGASVVGVVYDPSHDDLFVAARGRGATRNGAPVRVTDKADLATALIGTGFNYGAQERAAQGRVIAHVLPRVRDIRRRGAAALDLCWVACGRLDAYFERGLQAWDMAAGDLIVREAGGVTSTIEGGPAVPGSMLAATPALEAPLRALLRSASCSNG